MKAEEDREAGKQAEEEQWEQGDGGLSEVVENSQGACSRDRS